MTNEEAIARIREHKIIHKMNEPRAIYISEALDLAIKALKQEPILDKIREQVELEKLGYPPSAGYYKAIMKVLQIIDEYKTESEG